MSQLVVKVLLVEDQAGDARLLREMLHHAGATTYEVATVGTMEAAEHHLLAEAVDIVLLDLGLPDAEGLAILQRARAVAPHTPMVVLTGRDDEVLAIQALQEGAQDYLIKDQVDARGVQRALRHAIERQAMEEAIFVERERAAATLDCIGEAVVSSDADGNITFFNSVAERMSDWSSLEAIGRPIAEVIRLGDDTLAELDSSPFPADPETNRSTELRPNCILLLRSGIEIPIAGSLAPIRDRNGQPNGEVMVFRDVSASRAASQRMAHSAQHDFLTGLPNRMLFDDRLDSAISIAPRHDKKVAVLFLDLDGFKYVNDSLGHAIGDKLLQSVARRLVECVRTSDTVSRLGGDEFAILLSEVELSEDAAISARRILAAVAEPHIIDHHELTITTSIGIAVSPEDGNDGKSLIESADTAMYLAKESGRQGYQFFRPAMNARAKERQAVEDGLRHALERREFAVLYQPKINLQTGEITGAEALLRWIHPTLGKVAPAQFIPTAEACGLMLPIGAWVLRQACEQAQTWRQAGLPEITIAVNISAAQFRDPHFLASVFEVLAQTGVAPRCLELELPESVLIRHGVSTAAILRSLRDKGVRVAVDDFGTGYSSLGHLHKFPVDTLKIDKSFVHEIGKAGDQVVGAVIAIARSLNLRVIAEGVETLEERDFLCNHDCDDAQGYYFGHPVLPKQFAELLASGRQEVVLL